MSAGYGKVQNGCLDAIWTHEHFKNRDKDGKASKATNPEPPLTTYDIAAHVYKATVDDEGYWITDAQHVAVKRALGGLQRQGKVIGFAKRTCGHEYEDDARQNYGFCWMSEKRAQMLLRDYERKGLTVVAAKIKAKMRAIGMKP